MKTEILGMVGYMDIVLILMVVLVMFGAKKIPELAKGLGTGIKEFKKAARELEGDPDDLPAREQSAENVSDTDKHEHITAS